MGIPVAKAGDILIIPLSPLFNQHSMPLEGNAEEPIRQMWFNGADVKPVIMKPDLKSNSVVRYPLGDTKPKELNINLFLGNGGGIT